MGKLSRTAWLLVLLTAFACSSPLQVLKTATPNPFAAGAEPHFVLLPFDWSELDVDGLPVDEYVSTLDKSDREDFASEKRDAEEGFLTELVKEGRKKQVRVVRRDPEGTGYRLRVIAQRFSPPGEIELLLTIDAPDGRTIDELRLHEEVVLSTRNMRPSMERYGELLARYLARRVRP